MFQKRGISLVFLLLSFSFTTYAQITTNNALPVGQGKAIFRIQNKISSATGDAGMQRDRLVQAFPLVGVYGITPRLAVFGVLPILNKSLTLTTPQGRITRGGKFGLG